MVSDENQGGQGEVASHHRQAMQELARETVWGFRARLTRHTRRLWLHAIGEWLYWHPASGIYRPKRARWWWLGGKRA